MSLLDQLNEYFLLAHKFHRAGKNSALVRATTQKEVGDLARRVRHPVLRARLSRLLEDSPRDLAGTH